MKATPSIMLVHFSGTSELGTYLSSEIVTVPIITCLLFTVYNVTNFPLKYFPIFLPTYLVEPELLKYLIMLSYSLADCFEFMACLAVRCMCSKNINKYSNKPAKGYKRIILRF